MSTPNTTTKIVRSPLLAIFIALVFLAGPLPGPAELVEPVAAQATTLRVTLDDYETDVATLHGTNAYAYVVLTSATADTTEQRDVVKDVKVTSPKDTTGILIDLLETGPETGRFVGGFGFSTTGSNAPGAHPFIGKIGFDASGPAAAAPRIHVASGDRVTVAATGGTDSVTWRSSVDGLFTTATTPTTSPVRGTVNGITIQIEDSDLDTTSSADSHEGLLFVRSDSDPEGLEPQLIETGPATDLFSAGITLSTSSSATNALFVRPGDSIEATYRDQHDGTGLPQDRTRTWTFAPATDGAVILDRSAYIGTTQAGVESGLDRAVVTVSDGDPHDGAIADTVTVDVRAESSTGTVLDCVTLTLTQLPGTAVGQRGTAFTGTMNFDTLAQSAGCTTGDTLSVRDGNIVRAVYNDAINQNGVTTERRSDPSIWRAAETAAVTLGPSSAATILRGTEALFNVEVRDADSDRNRGARETIQVTARSDTNPTGVTLQLVETGVQTGRFSGTLQFSATDAANRLRATDGDLITVEYVDPVNAVGKKQIVSANGGQAIFWRADDVATVFTDATTYHRLNVSNEIGNIIDVFVEDQDRNDPTRRDTVTATAFSQPSSGGTLDQVTLTLNETGVDSGLFHATMGFEETSAAANRLAVGSTGAMAFVIEYTDEVIAGTNTRTASSGALTFRHEAASGQAVLRLEKDPDGSGPLSMRPMDRVFLDPDQSDSRVDVTISLYASGQGSSVTATLESARCNEDTVQGEFDQLERLVQLLPEGPSSRYVGTMKIRDWNDTGECDESGTPGANNFLAVDIGKDFWVNVTLADGTFKSIRIPTIALGDQTINVLDRAGSAAQNFGSVNGYGGFQVAGHDFNYDSQSRQVIMVEVDAWRTGQVTPTTTNLVAVETGVNTGTFRGSFGFNDASATGLDAAQELYVAGHTSIKRTSTFAGYGMYVGFDFLGADGAARDTATWWASGAASLEIERQAFGTQGFRAILTDQDAFPARIVQTADGSTTEDDYAFSDAGYIRDSELVLVKRTPAPQTVDSGTGSEGLQYKVTISPNGAAESVADRNSNGGVDCGDFVLTGQEDTNGPLPGANNVPSSDIQCRSATVSGSTYTFIIDWIDANGNPTCSQGSGTPATACNLIAGHFARSKPVTSCSSGATATEYRQTATGIRFCDEPGAVDLEFRFLAGSRTIKVQSRATADSAVVETESVTLTYDVARTASRGKPTFSGEVPVQTTAVANDGILAVTGDRSLVQFMYKDRVMQVDGGAGSDVYASHRAVRAEDQWRAAQSAAIKVMKPDFSSEGSTPVLGPAVFVEVEDKDSNRSPSQETIVIDAADASNTAEVVKLTLRESSTQTGKFRGILTVSAATGPDEDGVLHFGAGSGTIRFSFADPHKANGATETVSRNVDWRDAADGTIHLFRSSSFTGEITASSSDKTIKGTTEQLFIEVRDSDANRNSGVTETLEVRVHSTYDPQGEVITLTEISTDSPVFRSSGIGFQDRLVTGDLKVFTRDYAFNDPVGGPLVADEVSVTYDDPLDANGNRKVVRSATNVGWDQRFDGIADLDLAFYIGDRVNRASHLAQAHLTVTEGDANTNPRAIDFIPLGAPGGTGDYEIGRLSGGSIVSQPDLVGLVETGANTGVFIGVVTFNATGVGPTPESWSGGTRGVIPMENTQSLRFVYRDAAPASGGNTPLETFDTAQWYEAGYGVLGFHRAGYNNLDQPAVLRLYDADLSTGPSIRVTSEANTEGVSVSLTKKRDGVFQGSLTLRDTTGGTGLLVNDIDELLARYRDASPPGDRQATATVRVDDFEAPTTTLGTTPALPDGENGWFVSQPTVSFSADEPVQETFYTLDGGAPRLYTAPFPVTEGLHDLTFWSIDTVDNEEEPQEAQVKYDATPPSTQVANLTARSAPLGAIELNWAPVATQTDPLEFGSYKVFKGTTATLVGNSTTTTFSHTPDSDGTHTYLVAVADEAGNFDASKAVSISGISDRVAPRMVTASVSPTELFEEIDTNLTVTITGTVNEADLSDVDRVEASVLGPVGQGIANVTMTRQGTTNVWRGTFADFSSSGNYTFSIAALDVAGNAEPLDRNVRFHAIDDVAPVVNVPETVVQGAPLVVEVIDNDKGIATISYRLDGGAPVNVAVSGGPLRHTFSIQTGALALGTHSLSITVTDRNGTANFATYDRTFTVTDSSGGTPVPGGGAPAIGLDGKFVENGGTFQLVVRSQGPLTALTVSFDGGAAQAVLSSWSLASQTADVSVGSLPAGKHTVVVVATNAVETTTRSFEIYVLDEGIPLPPSNVQVTRGDDGFPKITWDASPSANVGGYLVHRASSPYKVIKVLDAETTEFTDRTAEAGKTYMYAVTAFSTTGAGRVDEGSESEGELPFLLEIEGSSFTVEEADSNFWTVFWVILILLVVVTAVVLLVVYRERIFRPRGEAGEIYDDDYPDASGTTTLPFGEQQHDLRCPNCTTEFSVTGEKPIVTTCPNCGKKGILR